MATSDAIHEKLVEWELERLEKADNCNCYECVGSDIRYTDDGHRYVHNNLKHHTYLEPCDRCGRLKTEYLDLGRKGYYVCWWCDERHGDDD